jgi:tRNA(Ile)-lysidine synthase
MVTAADDLATLVRGALPRRGTGVLAVSGGLDSIVLLDVAASVRASLGAEIIVATFDHASGAHSVRAAAFVSGRASEYGLQAVIGRASARARSEAAWRRARWEFLRDVAARTDGTLVTAHNRDDQIETVVIRALRGAGARGLAGLFAESDVKRPFIDVARAELRAYAAARGLEWVEDPTNRSRRFLRNRVRLDLLPAMRGVRSEIGEELLEVARRAASWRRELATAVDQNVDFRIDTDSDGKRTLDVAAQKLTGYSRPALGILWPELAARIGLTLDRRGTRRAAEFTTSSRSGSRIQLAGGWQLLRARGRFELRALGLQADAPAPAGANDPVPLREGTSWDHWSFSISKSEGERELGNPWVATLPASNCLVVRAWRPGDRLTVRLGEKLVARKVKYFLSDAGISGHIRGRWPVIVAGEEVVWIPGVRRSDAAPDRSGRPVVTYVCDYIDRRP